MKIEQRSIDAIKPYDRNPRINDPAVDAVAASIREFGFRQPVILDGDGVVIAGHTRLKAAQKLGLEQVPVHVATDLSPAQAKALRIADNKCHELSKWDLKVLPQELADLKALDVDLGLLGFDQDELATLLGTPVSEGLTDPDDIPAPPDQAVTQRGDLWVLGDHRLLCGDSGSAADLDRLLDGAAIQLVSTDPPYNVRVEPRSNNAVAAGRSDFQKYLSDEAKTAGVASRGLQKNQTLDEAIHGKRKPTGKKLRAKDRPLANDFLTDEQFDAMLDDWFGNIGRVLQPGRSFYIWGGWTNCRNYPAALTRHGLFWHQQVIWVKHQPVLTRKDMLLDHEWCFYGWKEGAGHTWLGPNNIRDVWEVKKVPQAQMVHLTEKPTELAVRAMQFSSRPGENVLDLFGGSGSTLIAAEQTGRKAFLMELDPLYCDVIVERWEKFTGKKAERVSTEAAVDTAAENGGGQASGTTHDRACPHRNFG